MSQHFMPVDVISVCSCGGEIRPLRFQIEQPDQSLLSINISEILSTKKISYVGAEAHIYRCRAVMDDRIWMFDLRYLIRSHCWQISQRIY